MYICTIEAAADFENEILEWFCYLYIYGIELSGFYYHFTIM